MGLFTSMISSSGGEYQKPKWARGSGRVVYLFNDAHKELLREKGEWGKSANNLMTSYYVNDPSIPSKLSKHRLSTSCYKRCPDDHQLTLQKKLQAMSWHSQLVGIAQKSSNQYFFNLQAKRVTWNSYIRICDAE